MFLAGLAGFVHLENPSGFNQVKTVLSKTSWVDKLDKTWTKPGQNLDKTWI